MRQQFIINFFYQMDVVVKQLKFLLSYFSQQRTDVRLKEMLEVYLSLLKTRYSLQDKGGGEEVEIDENTGIVFLFCL